MIEINEIVEKITSLEFDYEGQKIECKLAINAVSGKFLKSIEDDDNIDALCKSAAQVLRSINLSKGGKQIEPNADSLSDLPFPFVVRLNQEIADILAEEKKK